MGALEQSTCWIRPQETAWCRTSGRLPNPRPFLHGILLCMGVMTSPSYPAPRRLRWLVVALTTPDTSRPRTTSRMAQRRSSSSPPLPVRQLRDPRSRGLNDHKQGPAGLRMRCPGVACACFALQARPARFSIVSDQSTPRGPCRTSNLKQKRDEAINAPRPLARPSN